jgi:hypothetical protein
MVLDHTGASDIDFNFDIDTNDYSFNNGYIDHQSVEDKDLHYLFKDPMLLKAFIFGKGGLVHTDNDNCTDNDNY